MGNDQLKKGLSKPKAKSFASSPFLFNANLYLKITDMDKNYDFNTEDEIEEQSNQPLKKKSQSKIKKLTCRSSFSYKKAIAHKKNNSGGDLEREYRISKPENCIKHLSIVKENSFNF